MKSKGLGIMADTIVGLKYLFLRFDTYLVLGLGATCMVALSRLSPLYEKGAKIELVLSVIWPLSSIFWCGYAYCDGIALLISPFVALACGAGFALSALRRSETRMLRVAASVLLAVNVMFCFFPCTIFWTTGLF